MNTPLALRLFRQMQRIRGVEEEIALRYPQGKMRCPVHLSVGQEAIPAVFAETVRGDDFAVSTHRGHAHYLAKGGNLAAMIAEIYGKAAGCAKGKGGSMHLIDLAVNFMGTSAIVGNNIPVGVGLALSAQLHGTDQISCVFLGDGAVEQGVFYESVNFAVVRKLPVLFICENNLYSVYSPLAVRQPAGRNIASMVQGMGIQVASESSTHLLACHHLMQEAVDAVRQGAGPRFLEFATYRWREHCGPYFDNDIGYRSREEFLVWQAQDPLLQLETSLRASGHQAELSAIQAVIQSDIDHAFALAESAPFPDAASAYLGVYG